MRLFERFNPKVIIVFKNAYKKLYMKARQDKRISIQQQNILLNNLIEDLYIEIFLKLKQEKENISEKKNVKFLNKLKKHAQRTKEFERIMGESWG